MWLDKVKQEYKDDLEITWRNFSLEQNAYTIKQREAGEEGSWKVWEEPDPTTGRALLAAIAAEAARRQGEDAHARFHLALLTARHSSEERIALNEAEPILEIAREVGLDIERLQEDMKDPALAQKIGADHEEAVSHGIFGTPTYIFENGNMAFLKAFAPPQEEAAAEWEHFVDVAANRRNIGEIKRPQPPWPKDATD